MQAKADPKLTQLFFDSQYLQEQLADAKSALTVWRQLGLTQDETLELLSVFEKLKDEATTVKNRVEALQKDMLQTNEQQMQIIDNLLQLNRL